MIDTTQLSDRLTVYIINQLDSMAQSTPAIGFFKPLITRVLNKKLSKIHSFLELIADESGQVDIENIVTEMMESVMSTSPFKINTPYVGDIEVGGGSIKMNIPFTQKSLVFNTEDLVKFKETITV